MNLVSRLVVSGAAGLVVLAAVSVATAQSGDDFHYTLRPLNLLPGSTSGTGYGMNNCGQVVGYSWLGGNTSAFRATLWQADGTVVDLGWLEAPSEYGLANAINSSGQVTGINRTSLGWRGFLWTTSGGMQDLGELPGTYHYVEARDINDAGQITGESTYYAFVWDETGGMQDLGSLPGGLYPTSEGWAINNSGQVAGHTHSYSPVWDHAFLWTPGVGMVDLGGLPGGQDGTYVEDLNDHGQVVGRSYVGAGAVDYHAFLWDAEHGMRDLGDFAGGLDSSRAVAINNMGQVVGMATRDTGTTVFIWDEEHGMRDLLDGLGDTLDGWTLGNVEDINDLGEILISGVDPQGVCRPFVLTPAIPEPMTAGLVATGICALLARRRRTGRGREAASPG